MQNSILLQDITLHQLSELIDNSIRAELDRFKQELLKKESKDELLSRSEASELLKIDPQS